MTLSDRLKALRKAKGLTQEKLAEIIGVERSSIGKYETGTMPSIEIITALSEFFSVSIDYLIGKTDNPKSDGAAVTDDSIKFALFGGDGEVTDKMYKEVLSFVEFIKQKYEKNDNN